MVDDNDEGTNMEHAPGEGTSTVHRGDEEPSVAHPGASATGSRESPVGMAPEIREEDEEDTFEGPRPSSTTTAALAGEGHEGLKGDETKPFEGGGPPETSTPRASRGDDNDVVHEMLAVSALRQRTFRQRRESRAAEDVGVRDTRKCDYEIASVRRPSSGRRSAGRRSSSASGSGGNHAIIAGFTREDPPGPKSPQHQHRPNEPGGGDDDSDSTASEVETPAWRRHLEAHVARILRDLRLNKDEVRVLCLAEYPPPQDPGHHPETDEEESDDNGDALDGTCHQGDPATKPVSSSELSPRRLQRLVKRCLSVHDVYKRLYHIGIQAGEAVYEQIRSMLIKSVANGLIDRASNVVRLESTFKIELRRQVTLEKIRDIVIGRQIAMKKRRLAQRLRRATQMHKASRLRENVIEHDGSKYVSPSDLEEDQSDDARNSRSAYYFKLQALERVLGSNRNNEELRRSTQQLFVLTDQLDDQMQERIKAFVYSKNRDNFPFWKEPPENSFSREETTRQLRIILSVLAGMPTFRTLSTDALIDVARSTRWRCLNEGAQVTLQDQPIDELLIIMDGRVSSASTTSSPPLQNSRDSVECHGELGLLSKSETWNESLCVASPTCRILVLTREAFDGVLLKHFGGQKRTTQSRDAPLPRRPLSSPSVARTRTRSMLSRPMTAMTKQKNLESFREYRDSYVAKQHSEHVEVPCNEDPPKVEQPVVSTDPASTTTTRPAPISTGFFQHYPSFSPSTDGDVSSGNPQFRLKCTQPIAFGMESLEESIEHEWAPAFPDTPSMVNYFAATEGCFLYEKRNMLLKEHLRQVCASIPFHEEVYATSKRSSDEDPSFNQAGESSPTQRAERFSEADSKASTFHTTAQGPPSIGIPTAISDGDVVTLNQFTEARRKIFSRGTSARNGNSSPSMRNLLESKSTSAMIHRQGNTPFANSFFVPESSFEDKNRPKTRQNVVDEEEDSEPEVVDLRKSRVGSDGSGRSDVESDESASDLDLADLEKAIRPETTARDPTHARKLALDSLMHSLSTPSKKMSLDQEAARRIILQKHLDEAKLTDPIPSQGIRKGTVETRMGITALSGVDHPPLPLRIDLQKRMEAVLVGLKMKPKAKLDVVLKYTQADHYDSFPDAVVLWEQALHYITKRERALESLHKFELIASDPRRHFRSLSTHRLTEQKERDSLFYQLNYASDLCREALDEVEKRVGDQIYLESRLYREKMKKDYTELLYEVEQERLRMIYQGVHPAVVGSHPNRNASAELPAEDGERDTSSRCVSHAIPNRPQGIGKIPHRRPTQVPVNNNDEKESGELQSLSGVSTGGDARGELQSLSGVSTGGDARRYQLSTPRESIFVSVLDRKENDQTQARRPSSEDRRGSSEPREHQLSVQIKQYRQVQLDAAKNTTPTRMAQTPRNPPSLRTNQPDDSVRPVENAAPRNTSGNDLMGLKSALEHVLGRHT